jgi:hypothetical protein
MLKYNWILKSRGRQHDIQLQMDTILSFLGTGSGRLVIDGTTVREWGCNPFRMIPRGSCEFKIDDRVASIDSKFTTRGLFFLVLDKQEIPPIKNIRRETKSGSKQ